MPASETADGTEKAANASSGPGDRLRRAREAQGLQLEEVANELRIGSAALVALEADRFETLGAAVFARGYLKQYGTRLGLDVRELLSLYERAAGESEVELAPTKGIRMRDERQISIRVVAVLALVTVIGGLSYWWWRQSELDSLPVAADAGSDASTLSPAGLAAEEGESSPAALPTESEVLAATEPVQAAESVPAGERALAGEPEPELASALAVETTTTPAEDANVEAPSASAIEPQAEIDGPVLEVIFIADSWAEIIAEDGSQLYYDLGRAGTRARVPADRNPNIFFGNAAGVELRIDGEVVPVPRAAPSGIVRFDLDEVTD